MTDPDPLTGDATMTPTISPTIPATEPTPSLLAGWDCGSPTCKSCATGRRRSVGEKGD